MEGPEKILRDVRTLLLCRIKQKYLDSYGTIYEPPNSLDSRTFMTTGGFDAVKIYQTMPSSESAKPGWARHIYNDKENVIGAMNENISYHPIHLVSYNRNVEIFWTAEQREYPFFIMTFVYGVDKKQGEKFQKYSGEEYFTTSPSEDILTKYLDSKQLDSGKVKYAVYHAVNLSDLVILWFTADIPYTLGRISEIEMDGLARKTNSTAGLLMQNSKIPDFVESIANAVESKLNLRIRGSIRDHAVFSSNYSSAEGAHNGLSAVLENAEMYLTYGENDFLIISKPLSSAALVSLFKYWLENAEEWKDACWEIHTDIQLPTMNYHPKKTKNEIPHILNDTYKAYQNIYAVKLKKFKWASTFSELLSVYVNIDNNPVLHGPSYLVAGCVKIANSYFSGEVSGFENGSQEWSSLMSESEPNIERFVRNWSQLTDQVTRIDAVMLHGLGETVAIHNTLPEFIMDCYHSLMHKLVDLLVRCDQENGRILNNDFEYDFLFVPELNQRMRITKVFNTSGKYRIGLKEPCVWPPKQAYLMEFPAPYIYQPQVFFLQLAHECFHCFGDVLRLRGWRADCMALYLAAHFVAGLGYESHTYRNLVKVIGRKLHIKKSEGKGELYLEDTIKIFYDKLIQLANHESIFDIYHAADGDYYLHEDTCFTHWVEMEQSFFIPTVGRLALNTILATCKYYFRECYADAMMVAFLKLTPAEYLSLFQDEFSAALISCGKEPRSLKDIDPDGCFCKNVERISIVLAACCKAGVWEQLDCAQAITDSFQVSVVQGIQKTTFDALYKGDVPMPPGKWFSPANALAYVMDYLEKALVVLKEKFSAGDLQHEEFLRNYDSIIRKENLFGKEFYSVMRA